MTQILDGKKLSAELIIELTIETATLKNNGIVPHLVAILVGDNGASQTYVANKIKHCQETGIKSTLLQFPTSITEKQLVNEITIINNDPSIHGVIVQLPLPNHIKHDVINEAISHEKDVDGFHPMNTGRMMAGLNCNVPATPLGIMFLIERYKIPTVGKHVVVLGRSQIVGIPMSNLLSKNTYPGNCTVTLCHSKTENLSKFTRDADILIAAIGIPGFVTADMVKEGAVVIDVGITRVEDPTTKSGFRLKGDVNFDSVAPKTSFITPVPGGVGPMTIVGLLRNTIEAAKKLHVKSKIEAS